MRKIAVTLDGGFAGTEAKLWSQVLRLVVLK